MHPREHRCRTVKVDDEAIREWNVFKKDFSSPSKRE